MYIAVHANKYVASSSSSSRVPARAVMAVHSGTSPGVQDSLVRQLLVGVVVVCAVAAHTAGAASVGARGSPSGTLGLEGLEGSHDHPPDEFLDGSLDGTSILNMDGQGGIDLIGLQEFLAEGEPMDFYLAPYLWGLANHDQLSEMQLDPQLRILGLSLQKFLPAFNSSCSCTHFKCSCCTRMAISSLSKIKTACGGLEYIPQREAVALLVTFDNRTLIEREIISGLKPTSYCTLMPYIPFVKVCAVLSNTSLTQDGRIQACAGLDIGLVFLSPVFRFHFGCLQVGPGGISGSVTPVPPLADTTGSYSVLLRSASKTVTSPPIPNNDVLSAQPLNSTDYELMKILQIMKQQSFYEQTEPVQRSGAWHYPTWESTKH